MEKSLVLLSGGVDSATCLALAVSRYKAENVIALSVYYGQKHEKELDCAQKIADYYGVTYKSIDLKKIFEGSNCSLLAWSDSSVPEGEYSRQLRENPASPVTTYVPFRNGLFLSCAASVALAAGCSRIYYGAHSDDAAGNAYPDTSEEFNNYMNKAIYVGSGKALKIEAPFINLSKAEVVKTGLGLKVPYEMTWSCYNGKEKACGVCATCIDRKKAFALNGIKDPIEYSSEE